MSRQREIELIEFSVNSISLHHQLSQSLSGLSVFQFTVLDHRLNEIQPALREVLNSLLDPRLFSVDRGELHILLHQSKSLSEFHSVVKDIESTLDDVLEYEEDLAEMYLTHWATTGYDVTTSLHVL